jgi:CDP-glycerol glycerophosphotransferase
MTWALALGAPPGREGKGAGPGWITPTLAFEPSPSTWRLGANEVALVGGRDAEALLVVRPPRALLTEARWADEQVLDLAGALPDGLAGARLELVDVDGGGRTAVVDLEDSQTAGRFTAHLDPGSLDTGAGPLPLGEGSWALFTRLDGEPPRPMVMDARLRLAPPRAGSVGYKSFTLGAAEDDQAVLEAGRDLDADERGPYNRRRLERTAYAPARSEALRDAVVYLSFGGRRCSDSPRAIHAELVRRGAALEHVWVVRDGACRAPAGAEVVRDRGREQYEAMARARFVVTNDSLPAWFERREGQVCVQTFNGAPIKRLGRDAADTRTRTRFERSWERQAVNWQYGLSPNRLATPLLRGAYGIAGELLETGHPRVDPLVGGDGAQATRRARRELGVPEDARVVLYAPAVREHVVDRRGRARLDPRLDFPALRAALGPDTVLLFCADARVVDVAPSTGDGMVRDVSASPDASAPLAAADVLITDYSSVMADFANTGRPMLFYTYDLEAYRDRGPGFYLDLEALPGPLLSTAGEVGEALTDLPAVRREHAGRYADFRATYCELDDGRATARVVDRLFASW